MAEALSAARLALHERWHRSVAVEVRALTLANLGIAEFWADDFDEALEHLQAAAGLALEFDNDFVLFIAKSYLAAHRRASGQARRRAQPGPHRDPAGRAGGWTVVPHTAIALRDACDGAPLVERARRSGARR